MSGRRLSGDPPRPDHRCQTVEMQNAPIDQTAAIEFWEVYRAARPDRATDPERQPSAEVLGERTPS